MVTYWCVVLPPHCHFNFSLSMWVLRVVFIWKLVVVVVVVVIVVVVVVVVVALVLILELYNLHPDLNFAKKRKLLSPSTISVRFEPFLLL